MTRLFSSSLRLNVLDRNMLICSLGVLLSACGGNVRLDPNPQLTRINIAPSSLKLSLGQALQLTISGTYSDGTSADQTTRAQWTTSDASIATVSSTGLVQAKAIGTAVITASINSLAASTSLKVSGAAPKSMLITPSPVVLALGQTQQLTVKATMTDGTLEDVTHEVTWSIADPSVVTIDSNGLVSTLKAGNSSFTANLGAAGGSAAIGVSSTVSVSAAVLKSLQITAHELAMPLGTSQQLAAMGTFTDGSSRDLSAAALWSSSAASIVSLTATGDASALARGSATVSVTTGGISTSIGLSVGPPILSSIAIDPDVLRILTGQSVQLRAIGTYTDGSTSDISSKVTWTVANPSIIQLQNDGNVISLSPGSTGVEAALNGSAGKSTIVVTPVALVSYFSITSSNDDATVRIVGAAGADPEVCTMLYVFGQDQQMAECCGCSVSREGLRNLSLRYDLLSNPLTATAPDTGTVMVVTGTFNGNTSCNPADVSPAGSGSAWATHVQSSGTTQSATESEFTRTELGNDLLANLQAQCNYVQILGAGRGVCTCGTGN